jgi:tetratricopeptide (TPR) repeat protein
MAAMEARQGNDEISREYINKAISVWQQIDIPFSSIAELRWRFFGHFYLEEWDRAWEIVKEMQAMEYPLLGTIGSLFFMSYMLPEAAVRAGQLEEAEVLAQDAFELSQHPLLPMIVANSHFALGLVNSSRESLDDAINEYEEALSGFQSLGHLWDVAKTRLNMGKLYSKRRMSGDKKAAQKLFQESLDTFEKLEAKPAIEKVTREIEKLS